MIRQSIHKTIASDYLKLVPIVALALYLAFIPHQTYPYPVHIDEWIHLGSSQALMKAGSLTGVWSFYDYPVEASLTPYLEAGYYLFWGVVQNLSGLSWMTIFRYSPAMVFAMTILSVYILGKRKGFGWEAAFLVCLIPTTVGVLGPAFMVPVAIGLLFLVLSIYMAFNFRSLWSYMALLLFSSFLLLTHAPTAVGLVIIMLPYILLNLKGDFKHSQGLALAVGLPFLALPWVYDTLSPTFASLFNLQTLPTYIQWPEVIKAYGYAPTLLCVLGIFLLARRRGKKNYGLIFGFIALLLMLVIYIRFYYGIGIMYNRGLLYAMLIMGVIAGCGLAGIRQLRLPSKLAAKLRPAFFARNVGNILCIVVIGLTLAVGIPARQRTPYYHMIDQEDYQAFVWVRENVDDIHRVAVLDPWKATAFMAITGKNAYTRIHESPKASDQEAYDFLRDGCIDDYFLAWWGISIVYTRWGCNNPDLVQKGKYVYVWETAPWFK